MGEIVGSDVLALAEGGFTEETLSWYRERVDSSLYFFNKAVLGYPDLTPHLHQQMCRWIVDTIPDRGRGILIPRKFFKSTCVKGYCLWRLRNNTNFRILIVGENDQVGAKNLNDIKWHIQNNKLLQALYPNLIPPDFAATKWTTSEILLPRSKSFDEPTITTIGIGAKHTGFHYDLIVYDDPIGLEAAQSAAEMERARAWFEVAPGLLDSPHSEEIVVGTRWKDGRGDLYGWIMDELPFKRTEDGPQGFKWYIRSCIENNESIFPERYPIHELEKIRKRLGPYMWSCNMMNDPTIPGNVDFEDNWVKTYHIHPTNGQIAILDDTGEQLYLKNLVRVTVYDPSSGGISASAENAIIAAAMDHRRRILVLEAWAKNSPFGEAIEKWHSINDRYQCWRNYFEGIGAHKEVSNIVKSRPRGKCLHCGKEHSRLVPSLIEQKGISERSKEDRIRTLAQPAFEEGRVYLRQGMEKLRRQITSFPHGTLVDLFDALAYAISLLRPPLSQEAASDSDSTLPKRPIAVSRSHTSVDYGGYI